MNLPFQVLCLMIHFNMCISLQLGARVRAALPKLLDRPYSNTTFNIRFLKEKRTRRSAVGFFSGLFKGDLLTTTYYFLCKRQTGADQVAAADQCIPMHKLKVFVMFDNIFLFISIDLAKNQPIKVLSPILSKNKNNLPIAKQLKLLCI